MFSTLPCLTFVFPYFFKLKKRLDKLKKKCYLLAQTLMFIMHSENSVIFSRKKYYVIVNVIKVIEIIL